MANTPDPATNWVAISGTERHYCGLDTSGQVACWGQNFDQHVMAPTSGTFVDIAAGYQSSCALNDSNQLQCWGSPAGSPPPARYDDVVIGTFLSCGITQSGDLTCWGNDGYGQAAGWAYPSSVVATCSVVPDDGNVQETRSSTAW